MPIKYILGKNSSPKDRSEINLLSSPIRFKLFVHFVLIISLALFIGCEKKANEKTDAQPQTTEETTQTTPEQQPVQETIPPVVIPDLSGKWSGTFDARSATLNVTEQSGNDFSGSIYIAYRNPLNKQVTGKVDENTLVVTMSDMGQGRFHGTYSATLSDENIGTILWKKLTGTFTMKLDGKKYSFNFSKK
jgi:hypothetical protein